MDKPASLRKALAASFDVFQKHPDKLHLFITKGAIRGQKHSLSQEERYTLNVLITDWTQPMQRITAVIMDWLNIHQPELLRPSEVGNESLRFEAESTGNDQYDLLYEIDLNERVKVQLDPITGKHKIEAQTEPQRMDLS